MLQINHEIILKEPKTTAERPTNLQSKSDSCTATKEKQSQDGGGAADLS